MKSYINKICHYIPETKVKNEYIEDLFELPHGWIEEKSGIKGPRGIMIDYSGLHPELEMTRRIFKKFINENPNFNLQEIDCIITAGSSHTSNVPCGVDIANEYQLNNPFCFEMGTHCSGAITALEIAKNYILSGRYNCIVIINSEVLGHAIWSTNKKASKAAPLFGEGASLIVISNKKEGYEIGEFLTKCDTKTTPRPLTVSLEPPLEGETFFDAFSYFNEDFKKMSYAEKISVNSKYGNMDGKAVYMFLSKNIPDLLDDTLAKNSLKKEDIDWFIPHQANKIINDGLAQRYGIHKDKHITIVQDTANISSAGVMTALSIWNDKIKSGDNILVFAFGLGMFGIAVTIKKI